MTLFYELGTLTMKGLLLAFGRLEVRGRGNVPREGPLIVVSNHLNLADPPLLGAVIPRKIVFMAKEELFYQPVMSTVVKSYGAFPVKRNKPDRQALRRAAAILERGGVLGVFPEGKRNPHAGMSPAEAGIALIALMTRAAILPVGIAGTEEVTGLEVVVRRPRIRVNIGQPFVLAKEGERTDGKMLSALADRIMYRVADLLPPNYRGVYAGTDRGGENCPKLAADVESE